MISDRGITHHWSGQYQSNLCLVERNLLLLNFAVIQLGKILVARINEIMTRINKPLKRRDKQLLEELGKLVFFGSLLAIVCLVGLFFIVPSGQDKTGQDKIWDLSRAVITNLIPVPFLFGLSYLTYRRIQSITTEIDNESFSELIASTVIEKLNDPGMKISQITEIQKILSDLDIRAMSRSLINERYGGIATVQNSLYVKDIEPNFIESKTIVIMNTWIPNLDALSQSLITAINNRSEVRIMMLYPNSGVATLRSEALMGTGDIKNQDDRVKMGVLQCLETLNLISKEIEPQNRRYLKIKLFNSLPSISVYAADEHFFVSFFMHGQLAIKSPQLEIHSGTSIFGKSVLKEINTLWEIGEEIGDIGNWSVELSHMARKFNN
ncbi:MAG: hypothetical protein ACKPJF_14340 [Dolichospermum sp.]